MTRRIVWVDTASGASPADERLGKMAYEAYAATAWPAERRASIPSSLLPWEDLEGIEKRGWIAAAKAGLPS